jgi:hypothetical protein
MSLLSPDTVGLQGNPLDMVEEMISGHGWTFERQGEEELTASATGRWCAYQLWFTWRERPGALQFSCAFDLKVSEANRERVSMLLALVNERMWLGHFDLWSDEGVLMFHHALLSGVAGVSPDQCEDLVEVAIDECERFYPAFYFVLRRDMSPEDAIVTAMMDPAGEA